VASTVEIIIKAVDKYSKEFQKTGISMRAMAKAAALVGAEFALLNRVFDATRQYAEKIGRTDVVESIDKMSKAFDNLGFTLLNIVNVGGQSILDWMKDAAQGAENLGNLTNLLALKGQLDEINRTLEQGSKLNTAAGAGKFSAQNIQAVDELTDAERQLLETRKKELEQEIKMLAEGKSHAALKTIAIERNVKLKNSVTDLWEANKKLRDSYNEINDAIRAGDARAIAAIMRGTGGGAMRTGLSGARANVSGVSGSMNKGATTIVNVIVDNEIIRTQTRKTIAEDIFKPTVKGGNLKR